MGSAYYFGVGDPKNRAVLEACFLEMLGTRSELAFQATREGKTQLERCLVHALKEHAHRTGVFRSIICNDEIVWESYGIPHGQFISLPLSRIPF